MNDVATPKPTISEQLRTSVITVAGAVSDADRRALADLVEEARRGAYAATVKTITPGMGAMLFLNHNPHNRDWSPLWSQELQRRMTTGQWRKNNASIGFYADGVLADGQNRCVASALANFTMNVPVVFGIDRDAITTIDNGKLRHASDAVKLEGISHPKRKEALVKTVAAYMVKTGDRSSQLRSETEIARQIERDNVMLEDAIEIGMASANNIATPQLKEAIACGTAYLMLKGNWPTSRIREKLAAFQTGVSQDGENEPFFVAATVLGKARDARTKKDRLTPVRELGVVMYAMTVSEKGITAVQRQKFKDAIKNELPSPAYPADLLQQAA